MVFKFCLALQDSFADLAACQVCLLEAHPTGVLVQVQVVGRPDVLGQLLQGTRSRMRTKLALEAGGGGARLICPLHDGDLDGARGGGSFVGMELLHMPDHVAFLGKL